jgi:drug/metabolite transporter (DMT)-like permease
VVVAVSPLVTSAYISTFAALSFLLFGLANRSLHFDFSWATWGVIAGVVIFSTILAMASFFAGMERIGATRASILSTVEPVVTIGCSALLLGDRLSWLQGVGSLLVLAGAMWVVWQRRQPA